MPKQRRLPWQRYLQQLFWFRSEQDLLSVRDRLLRAHPLLFGGLL
jgi:hypothetical protein